MIVTEEKFLLDTKAVTSYAILLEQIRLVFAAESPIFLSHSHSDVEYVLRVKELLQRHGYVGYVDWEDVDMPSDTSGETAKKLKIKIQNATKFILIATERAISSKWCNWELGYGDAHKFLDNIAIFPIKSNYSDYKGMEYLQLYPSIQVRTNTEYYVAYPNGKELSLSAWLKL